MSRFSLVLLLLLSFSFPAAAGIVAGPEQPVSAPAIDAAAVDQYRGRIASDGDGFLVVWPNGGEILGMRLSAAGKRLDPSPLLIAGTSDFESSPEVAWGRSRHLVTWRTSTGASGRFVAPDATMSEPFTIIEGEAPFEARAAFSGEVFLAVWRGAQSGTARAAIIDLDGGVGPAIDLVAAGSVDDTPKVVAARGAFYVLTRTPANFEIALTRIEGDGTAGAPLVIAPQTEGAMTAHLAAQGDEVVVAWNRGGRSETTPIRAAVVGAAAGEPFDAGQGWLRTVVSDRAGAVLVYDSDRLYARRLGASDARPLARPEPLTIVTDGASNGREILFVIEVWRTVWNLYVQSLGERQPELVSAAPRHQTLPEIATIGELGLVVWTEATVLRAARVAADGVGAPFDVAGLALYNVRRVAAGDGQWLVVFYFGTTIRAVRVSAAGEVLDPEPFTIATGDVLPALDVAWDGSAFVVAFLRGRIVRFNYSSTVTVVRVSPDGAVGSEIALTTQGDHRSASVAATPRQTAVVWEEAWLGFELRGVLLSPGGTVTPLAFPSSYDLASAPVVESNGETFVVAARFRTGIRWYGVSDTGVVTEPPATAAIHPPLAGPVDLTAFGDRFLLLMRGAAATIDLRGWTGGLAPLVNDPNARVSGGVIAYARPVEAAWPNITRVFVRRIGIEPDAPRRRAVR